ncbi:hypothetical protein NLG97_g5019 [Lecanicillium saksenae]|uniref:Uncharacterized protein n=1 Tax=Lecanicillium saksenae TaxID=468837 RepID=A0ACC1QVC9_9HYPO|nr:hypothetical protein NLG97_g5019 [Lecanicillium saksenae]
MYLLSFLGKANIGNARIEGMVGDLKMTNGEYKVGLMIYFISYVLFEVKETRAARFFLGVSEAGLFPGIIWMLSMWYKPRDRQYRIAIVVAGTGVSGVFGGLIAWAILHMRGIVWTNGWRWIFIFEGIATVLTGVIAYFVLESFPSTAKFLSPAEKEFIHQRLALDSDATIDEKFSWGALREALTDIITWLYCLIYHTLALTVFAGTLFQPTIIKNWGFSTATTQLLTIPSHLISPVIGIGMAILSERLRMRGLLIAPTVCLAATGHVLLISIPGLLDRPSMAFLTSFICSIGMSGAATIII